MSRPLALEVQHSLAKLNFMQQLISNAGLAGVLGAATYAVPRDKAKRTPAPRDSARGAHAKCSWSG